jgi:hypothetical protein
VIIKLIKHIFDNNFIIKTIISTGEDFRFFWTKIILTHFIFESEESEKVLTTRFRVKKSLIGVKSHIAVY